MKEFYEKSLQEIRNIGRVLPRKHRNKLAVKKKLLLTESLEHISGMKYEALCLQILNESVLESNVDKLLT